MGGCLCGSVATHSPSQDDNFPDGDGSPRGPAPIKAGTGAKMPPRGDRGRAPKRHGAEAGMSSPRGAPRRPENVHGPSNLMAQ
jgi:hypothetical protein